MSVQPGGGNWKRIGSHTKDTGKMNRATPPAAQQPAGPAEAKAAAHAEHGAQQGNKQPPMGRFSRFLKYKGDAYCHTHEGLYMLMPEAEPSLGYKLQQITGNIKPITDQGEEISEDAAIHVIFRNLNASQNQ